MSRPYAYGNRTWRRGVHSLRRWNRAKRARALRRRRRR